MVYSGRLLAKYRIFVAAILALAPFLVGQGCPSPSFDPGSSGPPSSGILFATGGFSNVAAFNVSAIDGNVPPAAELVGPLTQLASPRDLVIDNNGALLVCESRKILVFSNAADLSGITGNTLPTRIIEGDATNITGAQSMAMDRSSDLLFVSQELTDDILVFADVSTADFDGNVAPVRHIMSEAMTMDGPLGIDLGANGDLYVANNVARNVIVFADAASLDGRVTPTRTITITPFNSTTGINDVVVDDDDHLFVATSIGVVYIFDNASTLDGEVSPDRILTVDPAGSLTSIVVDSLGNGYLSVNGNHVYTYESIATRDGTLPPYHMLVGSETRLFPHVGGLFLLE